MKNKKDSVCFDISSLNDDQKRSVAKGLKKTVDSINKDLGNGENPKEDDSDE